MSDTYEVRHERRPVDFLRHYEPNPRVIRNKGKFLALCRSIAEFNLAQTVCALDDGRVLGGNQTLDAVLQLSKGFEAPRADGKPGTERLQWSPPGGQLDVMVVYGASAEQAAALNLALNRHAGEDVEDEVQRVLREIQGAAPHLLSTIDSDDEINRLLGDGDPPRGGAPQTKGVPSITLQFTSAAAHTRVKQALAAAGKRWPPKGEEKVPSGDLLDRLLTPERAPKVSPAKAPPPEPAKKKGAKRAPKA